MHKIWGKGSEGFAVTAQCSSGAPLSSAYNSREDPKKG